MRAVSDTFTRRYISPPPYADLTWTRTEATTCLVHSARRLRLPIETGRAPQPNAVCVRIAMTTCQVLLHCIVYRVSLYMNVESGLLRSRS